MKKKIFPDSCQTVFSRDTCWWPTRHHYLPKPGGGGGGLGGVAYKDRAWPPPRAGDINSANLGEWIEIMISS